MSLRQWATPLVIGAFLATSVTGILMFFHVDTGLNKLLHEWIGLVMVAGGLAHVAANWRAFTGYFSRLKAQAIIAAGVVALGLSFIPVASAGPEAAVGALAEGLSGRTVAELATFAGRDQDAVIAALKASGTETASAEQTVAQLAEGDVRREIAVLSQIMAAETQ